MISLFNTINYTTNILLYLVLIVYSSFNIYYYEKLKARPSINVSNNIATSMYIFSIILLVFAFVGIIFNLVMLYYNINEKRSVIKTTNTLNEYDLSKIQNVKPPVFNTGVKVNALSSNSDKKILFPNSKSENVLSGDIY